MLMWRLVLRGALYGRTPDVGGPPRRQAGGSGGEQWPPTPEARAHCPSKHDTFLDPYCIRQTHRPAPPLPAATLARPATQVRLAPCSPLSPAPFSVAPCTSSRRAPWRTLLAAGAVLALLGALYQWYLSEMRRDGSSPRRTWVPRNMRRVPASYKDLPSCVQYLIVGTGAAGWAAYSTIRRLDRSARVFLVSREDCPPYARPPLSQRMWFIAGAPDVSTLEYPGEHAPATLYRAYCTSFLPPHLFKREGPGAAVSLALGYHVTRVDPEDHCVWIKTPCGETPLYYERLLLAPGVRPRRLPALQRAPDEVRAHVLTLRDVRDFEHVFTRVRDPGTRHVTIVGAGPLGTELAWHMARAPKEVHLVKQHTPGLLLLARGSGPLGALLPDYLSRWLLDRVSCAGVSVRAGMSVHEAVPTSDGRVELHLSDGSSVVTDLVLECVGSEVNDEVARASGLEVDGEVGGVAVSAEMQARTDLYVAGDAASYWSPGERRRVRHEHEVNARGTGEVAGANMAGRWSTYSSPQHFLVRLGRDFVGEWVGEAGRCLSTVGLFRGCAGGECEGAGETELREQYGAGLVFYVRDERVVGVLFWNFPAALPSRARVVEALLEARPCYRDAPLLAELLGFGTLGCRVHVDDEKKPCLDIENRRHEHD